MKVVCPSLLASFRGWRRCERCGRMAWCCGHHLWPRGHGGGGRLDIEINLAALCCDCHRWAHDHGNWLTKGRLVVAVARRERIKPQELRDTIYLLLRTPKGVRLCERLATLATRATRISDLKSVTGENHSRLGKS